MASTNKFIPLGVGRMTEIAAELVRPGALLLIENGISDQLGRWVRRQGGTLFATSSTPTQPTGGTLATPWRLAELNGQLVRFNQAPDAVNVWGDQGSYWTAQVASASAPSIKSDRTGPTAVRDEPVFMQLAAGQQTSCPDVAIGNGYVVNCFEYTNPSQTCVVTVKDEVSNVTVYSKTYSVGTRRARPFIVGTNALIAYDDNGTLKVDRISLTAGPALAQTASIGTCTAATPIQIRGGSVLNAADISILYRDAAGLLRCAAVRAAAIATNSTFEVQNTGSTMAQPDLAFNWIYDIGASTKFSVVVANTTNGLIGLWNLPAPTAGVSAATATHTLDATATAAPSGSTPGIRNLIAATVTSSATGVYRVLYEVTAPLAPTTGTTKEAVYNGSATLTQPFLGVGIRSEFWQSDTHLYFWVAREQTDQGVYMVYAIPYSGTATVDLPAPQAIALPRAASGLTERVQHPSSVATAANGERAAAFTENLRVESTVSAGTAIGTESTIRGIENVYLSHRTAADTSMGVPAQLIDSLFVPGGSLAFFDGHAYGMAGFAYRPPPISAVAVAAGNLTADSSYSWKCCYSFVDNNGRKWRSDTTDAHTLDIAGGDRSANVTGEYLRTVDRDVYQVELYRSLPDAPGAWFLVASFPNNPLSATWTVLDNVADINLGEELYTDGGAKPNQLLPPMNHVCMFQGRLVGFERGTMWYSEEVDFTRGLIFNEAFTRDIGDPSDPVTAAASTDNYLVVFKKDRAYVVSGQGANALGQGANYEVQKVEGGVGTENAPSVCVDPDGAVWFNSTSTRAGIFRVVSGNAEYVGDGVRDFAGLLFSGATVIPTASEVRLHAPTGNTLVWNWVSKTWSVNTGQAAATACTWRGHDVYATSGNSFFLDQGATETEGGVGYTMKLRSPWYQISAMESWERIRRITGAGTPIGAHRLTARVYADYDASTPIGTVTKLFAGGITKWDWFIRPIRQKMTAMMIELEIGAYDLTDPVYTRGPAVEGITLEVEIKRGTRKLPASRRLVHT